MSTQRERLQQATVEAKVAKLKELPPLGLVQAKLAAVSKGAAVLKRAAAAVQKRAKKK